MPRQLLDAYGHVRPLSVITPIARGGTAADNAAQAVENLQGINRNKIDVPLGVAGADQNGYLLKKYLDDAGIYSGITLEGPTSLIKSSGAYTFKPLFFISNFHTQLPPVIGFQNANITDTLDTNFPFFSFNTPTSGNELVFSMNGKNYTLPLVDNGVEAPKLTDAATLVGESFYLEATKFKTLGVSNINDLSNWSVLPNGESRLQIDSNIHSVLIKGRVGANGVIRVTDGKDAYLFSKSQAQMTLSPEKNTTLSFLIQSTEPVNYAVMHNTMVHSETEWEISQNAQFSQIALWKVVNVGDLTKTFVSLPQGTYFARCRYRAGSVQSPWSATKQITVKTELNTLSEYGLVMDRIPGLHNLFGAAVDTLGNLLVVGSPGFSETNYKSGCVSLYHRDVFQHTYVDTILPPVSQASALFGMGLSIDKEGDLFIGSPGVTGGGAVYHYSDGATRVLLDTILPVSGSVNFGFSVKVTSTCLLIGDPLNNTNGPNSGAVHVYKKTLTGYVFSETLYPTTPAPNEYFGISITAVEDGSRIFIGSTSPLLADSVIGKVYIFNKTNEHFNESMIRNSPFPLAGTRFTRSMDYCQKTNTLYIGCEGDNAKGPSAGAVYRFACDLTPENITINYVDTITPVNGDIEMCFGTGVAATQEGNQLYVGVSQYKLNNVTSGGVFFFS